MRFFKEVLWITKTPDLHWVCLHFVHGHSGASEAFPHGNHRPWNICDIPRPEEKSSWLVLHTSPRHLRQRRSIANIKHNLIHSLEKSIKVSQDAYIGHSKNSKARQLPTQIHAYILWERDRIILYIDILYIDVRISICTCDMYLHIYIYLVSCQGQISTSRDFDDGFLFYKGSFMSMLDYQYFHKPVAGE